MNNIPVQPAQPGTDTIHEAQQEQLQHLLNDLNTEKSLFTKVESEDDSQLESGCLSCS